MADIDALTKTMDSVVRKYRWLQRLAEALHGGFVAFLTFLGGRPYHIDPPSLPGRILNGAWVFALKILSASYTANLCATLVALDHRIPLGSLGASRAQLPASLLAALRALLEHRIAPPQCEHPAL